MKKILLSGLLALLLPFAGQAKKTSPFVTVNEKGQFVRNGKPYYYIGANFWYGAILASKGQGGNRERLKKELDELKKLGISNLRVLVGADGENGVKSRVEPSLQTAPGVYNDTILDGLDYLMKQLAERKMTAVLYLNNAWEWSGGYSVYQQWAGMGKAAVPAIDGWPAYMSYVQGFVNSKKAQELFSNHVRYILGRTNRYTHKKYTEDAAIFSWQICNEPRAFSNENKPAFAAWLKSVAAEFKALDKNHLLSTGSEGSWGCENDMELYRQIHSDKNIDYLTIHIWPYNWNWAKKEMLGNTAEALKKTSDYIQEHQAFARETGKPLVIEEFGYPRDSFSFVPGSPASARNAYYKYIFQTVADSHSHQDVLAGCNFWAWGGLAVPKHEYWQRWDDYTGDPAQEQQGLNSVFSKDASTLALIRDYTRTLNN